MDEIGTPVKKWPMEYTFRDTQPPTFISDTPTIVPSDTGVTVNQAFVRIGDGKADRGGNVGLGNAVTALRNLRPGHGNLPGTD